MKDQRSNERGHPTGHADMKNQRSTERGHAATGDDLDEALFCHLATRPERDAGFTLRVLTALPRRRIGVRARLLYLLVACALATALALFPLGGAAALADLPAAFTSPTAPWPLLVAAFALLSLAATALVIATEALD